MFKVNNKDRGYKMGTLARNSLSIQFKTAKTLPSSLLFFLVFLLLFNDFFH